MSDRIFEIELTIGRTVRVRIPDDIVKEGETHESVAEEIALGGKESWPEYVIRENDDADIDWIQELKP